MNHGQIRRLRLGLLCRRFRRQLENLGQEQTSSRLSKSPLGFRSNALLPQLLHRDCGEPCLWPYQRQFQSHHLRASLEMLRGEPGAPIIGRRSLIQNQQCFHQTHRPSPLLLVPNEILCNALQLGRHLVNQSFRDHQLVEGALRNFVPYEPWHRKSHHRRADATYP